MGVYMVARDTPRFCSIDWVPVITKISPIDPTSVQTQAWGIKF